jgi:LysM repeat protein/lysophospholipase L1-like esterase
VNPSRTILISALAFTAWMLMPAYGFSQSIPPDSLDHPDCIKRHIVYDKTFPFIHYADNFVEWCDFHAIRPFFDKLKNTHQRKVKIVHIGDSHIQTDYFTGFMRNRFQKMFGFGGRGFIFPYNAAGTHSAYDYRTPCSGTWTYCRNIQANPAYDIGLCGATVRTTDTTAMFRFVFLYENIKENFTQLKLYVKQSPSSYNLKLRIAGYADTLRIRCNRNTDAPYVMVNLPMIADTLEFFIDKTDESQNHFTCYGLLLESSEENGILYSSVGINGAGYKSLLRQNLMPAQLKELQPDLLILDLGGNDFLAGRIYPEELKKDISAIIDIIRDASPETNIILGNVQDFYRRKVNVGECRRFAELVKEIAIAKNCAFYNYYHVSGGRYSMNQWHSHGLAQRDKVHLNHAGYHVRGELFLNALLASYHLSLTRENNDTLLVHLLDSTDLQAIYETAALNTSDHIRRSLNEKRDPAAYNTVNPKPGSNSPSSVPTGNRIFYKVKSGDNLGAIALRHKVSVAQLQQWNNIRGTTIYAGQTLVIYGSSGQSSGSSGSSGSTGSAATGRKITHKVVSGDTLWGLSAKYDVPVEQIRKQNNLQSNSLQIGQVLTIQK